jgi:hypothetical protein
VDLFQRTSSAYGFGCSRVPGVQGVEEFLSSGAIGFTAKAFESDFAAGRS